MSITIPPEALEAGARAVFRVGFDREPLPDDDFDMNRLSFARKYARAAFLAMVEAWPGRTMNTGYEVTEVCGDHLILPLQQEN